MAIIWNIIFKQEVFKFWMMSILFMLLLLLCSSPKFKSVPFNCFSSRETKSYRKKKHTHTHTYTWKTREYRRRRVLSVTHWSTTKIHYKFSLHCFVAIVSSCCYWWCCCRCYCCCSNYDYDVVLAFLFCCCCCSSLYNVFN